MTLSVGEEILNGKYRILRLLGDGAFARVWLAEETALSRHVAIKEIKRESLPSSEAAEVGVRFHREMAIGARLNNVPNVIRVFTAEQLLDGEFILVMEYASGGSLDELIAKSPSGLPLDQTLAIANDILQALALVHKTDLEVIHRDLKPSNILFGSDGRARISDFGLAQLSGTSARSSLGSGPHPGTPMYMAPEQESGQAYLAPTADIYALGCIIFEMLTGKKYKRNRPGITASSLRPDVPAWLDSVVVQALEQDPWSRWQTAGEMAAAIQSGRGNLGLGNKNPVVVLGPQFLGRFKSFVNGVILRERTKKSPMRTGGGLIGTPPGPPPIADGMLSEPDPNQGDPLTYGRSLVLRRELAPFLGPVRGEFVGELLADLEPRRVTDFVAKYGHGRFIVTGYRSFGGTTMVDAISQAIQKIVATSPNFHGLLVCSCRSVQSIDDERKFHVFLQEQEIGVFCGSRATEAVREASSFPPLTVALDLLLDITTGRQLSSSQKRQLGTLTAVRQRPSHVLVSVDKVDSIDSLEMFLNHKLLEEQNITVLLVAPKEEYDRWHENRRYAFNNTFREIGVASLWEDEYHIVEKILSTVFRERPVDSREEAELRETFGKHLAFVGRGSLGNTLRELQRQDCWRFDRITRDPFLDLDRLDRNLLGHNAGLQDILQANWSCILGTNFAGRERADRARQGVYAFIDWVVEVGIFSHSEALAAAERTPVSIWPHKRLRDDVVFRVLDVLVGNQYLRKIEDDFEVIWGRDMTAEGVKLAAKVTHSDQLSATRDRINALERQRSDLIEEFQAANDQLRTALSEVDRIRLQRQIKDIEQKLQTIETEVSETGLQ